MPQNSVPCNVPPLTSNSIRFVRVRILQTKNSIAQASHASTARLPYTKRTPTVRWLNVSNRIWLTSSRTAAVEKNQINGFCACIGGIRNKHSCNASIHLIIWNRNSTTLGKIRLCWSEIFVQKCQFEKIRTHRDVGPFWEISTISTYRFRWVFLFIVYVVRSNCLFWMAVRMVWCWSTNLFNSIYSAEQRNFQFQLNSNDITPKHNVSVRSSCRTKIRIVRRVTISFAEFGCQNNWFDSPNRKRNDR